MPATQATPAGPGAAAAPAAAVTPQGAVAPAPLPGILLNLAAPPTVALNGQFSIVISIANAANLFGAQFVMTYDPTVLDYVAGREGAFLKGDGKPTTFQATGAQNLGQVTVNASRVGNVGGVNGAGALASLTFRAKSRGAANLAFSTVHVTDPGGGALSVMPFKAVVNVK